MVQQDRPDDGDKGQDAPVEAAPREPLATIGEGAAEPVAAPPLATPDPVATPEPAGTVVSTAGTRRKTAARTSGRVSAGAARKTFLRAPAVAVAAPAAAEAALAVGVVSSPDDLVSPAPGAVRAIGFHDLATKLKGLFDMASFPSASITDGAKLAGEKATAVIGDINERAKAALEKSSKMGGEIAEITKGNVEALVASARVMAKGTEQLAQEAAEYSKKNFESVTTALKTFASVKSPTELMQLQSEYAKTSFDSAVAEASKFSESWMKLMGEAIQPLSSRYAVAAEKLKPGL